MPLSDHAPVTLRFVFAACAAATRSPLSATQRASIIMALHDPDWMPSAAGLPDTWSVVEVWYERLQAQRPLVSNPMAQVRCLRIRKSEVRGDDGHGW